MLYTIYILYSKKDGELYTGCTTDVTNRLAVHNRGEVPSTRNRRPLVLIYSEKLTNKAEAFKRERFFKSLWSGRIKKKILKEHLENNKG